MAQEETAPRQPQFSYDETGELPQAVKTAVLISNKGSGTNLQAIIDASLRGDLPQAQIGLVISDKADAQGLERARNHKLPWEVMELANFGKDRDEYSRQLAQKLNLKGVKIAVLAGFATILTKPYFDTFQGVTINIHPGLLPNPDGTPFCFPDGTEAPHNKRLLTNDAVSKFLPLKWAGSTIHVATLETDSGPVIERADLVEVQPGDNVESLYARLKPKEHEALIRALQNPRKIFEISRR